MVNKLQTQLDNSEEIKGLLKNIPFSHTLPDGEEVSPLLVYLPINKGKSNHAEFFQKVKEGILANFVFKCSYIQNRLGVESAESHEELFEKAVKKLSQHTAKGELGELILFTLLDVYISAPKLLSKVAMKTSRRMPVYGADAIHGQHFEEGFRLYFGESKLHKSFKSAATDTASSIKSAKDNYEDEFLLLDTDMDFPSMADDVKEELRSLFDPFSDNDMSDVIHSACFIGFNEPDIIADESNFIVQYQSIATDYVNDFYTKAAEAGVNINEATLLMLPFSCIDELTEAFIDYMGIKK